MDFAKDRHAAGRFSAWLALACRFTMALWALLWASICWSAAALPSRWEPLSDTVFQHLSRSNGLPHQVVTSLAEDGAGFVWMGTQGGLARWDGYRFKVFQPDTTRPGSLNDNNILSLYTDRSGRLWVATLVGVARYDPALDQFIALKLRQTRVAVYGLLDDGQQGMWIGSRDGLQHVAADGRLLAEEADLGDLAHEDIHALLREPDGRMWVGARNGLWYRNGNRGPFLPFQLQQGRTPFVLSLQRSSDGRLWVGTNGTGAYLVDPKKMTVQALQGQDSDTAGLNNLVINAIHEVGNGEVWLGSSNYGVVAVDRDSLRMRRMRHEVSLSSSVAEDGITSFLRDRSGLVWVGTYRGVSRYDPRQSAILSIFGNPLRPGRLSDTDVASMRSMPDGSLWVGLRSKGVNIISPERQIKYLPSDPDHPDSALPSGPVRGFSLPIAGWVYLATNRGLYRSDVRGQRLERVNTSQRDPAAAVVSMLQQGERLWLGGVDGIWLIDFAKGEPMQAQRVAGSEALNKQLVMVIEQDRRGHLWLGTRDSGVARFDPKQGTLQTLRADVNKPQALSSDSIASILEDRQGQIWIGTQGGGICLVKNPAAGSLQTVPLQRIGSAQGLPNNLVNKLLEDEQGQIWASTDEGLAMIAPANLKVRPLRLADGVSIPSYWTNSGARGAQGEIMFGGAGGITLILPQRLRQFSYRPPLVITHVELGGHAISPDQFSHAMYYARPGTEAAGSNLLAAQARSGEQRLPLQIRPQSNNLTVEFSALDYVAPEHNRYAYRLDGYDNDWIDTDPTRRLAAYANLAPGEYVLRLRGSNHLGLWNEEELRLPLQVLPAWYQTWWWYLLVLAGLAALMWGLVQVRTGYLRKRQSELENVVSQRTTQLLQQAKIASLGTLTAGIAHEIDNPSNFAHVGAYNLGTQLQQFQQLLNQLAGDDAPQELRDTLQQQFDQLNGSLAAISEGTSRIRNLVKDLRTFSRLDEAQWKPVAIADSLLATVSLVRTQYANQVEIRCDLAANPVLECSPAQLNQVFMNLIVNACQAICDRPPEVCERDPGLLTISSRVEGKWLVFEFADNGGGIPDAIRERIFDPFFTTKTVGEGMGMGLSISLGIIQKHRGSIELRTEPGRGSCFIISLLMLA